MSEAVLGAILAGGLARRMGGGDKALRRVGSRTMLDRVVERVRPQCCVLVLNANGDPSRFAAFGLPVVPDGVAGFAGPLAGILAALDHAAARHPEVASVLTVPADAPFLPSDLVQRLRAARDAAGAAIACAASGGRTHHVVALWPVAIREELRQALLRGERKVGRFAAADRVALVEWPSEAVDPFFNANTPDDLAAAERWLAGGGGGSAEAPLRPRADGPRPDAGTGP